MSADSRGGAVNVIPDVCELLIGVRLLPGMDSPPVIDAIRQRVGASSDSGEVSVDIINDNPPMLCDAAASVYIDLCELIGQTESPGVSFASDAGALSQAGFDCVLFGPGTIEVAHRPNECLPIDEFERAREILDALIQRRCAESA